MQKQKTKVIEKKPKRLSRRIMKELARSEEHKLTGQHEKALCIAENILIEDPECLEAVEEVADNLLSLDRMEEAKKAGDHALKLDKRSYIGHFVVGFVASEYEIWDKAVRHFQLSNFEQPNNPEILRCLGWTLFHSQDQSEGIATLQRSKSLRPKDPAILCDLAACYLQINHFNEAISLLEEAIEIDSTETRVRELLDVANRLRTAFSRETS